MKTQKLLRVLGKYWTVSILSFLDTKGVARYSEIKKKFKITPRIMALRLKELRELGLITKNSKKNIFPPRVYYSLSIKGVKVFQTIEILKRG